MSMEEPHGPFDASDPASLAFVDEMDDGWKDVNKPVSTLMTFSPSWTRSGPEHRQHPQAHHVYLALYVDPLLLSFPPFTTPLNLLLSPPWACSHLAGLQDYLPESPCLPAYSSLPRRCLAVTGPRIQLRR